MHPPGEMYRKQWRKCWVSWGILGLLWVCIGVGLAFGVSEKSNEDYEYCALNPDTLSCKLSDDVKRLIIAGGFVAFALITCFFPSLLYYCATADEHGQVYCEGKTCLCCQYEILVLDPLTDCLAGAVQGAVLNAALLIPVAVVVTKMMNVAIAFMDVV